MGPGEDYAQLTIPKDLAGPLTVEGGDGRDLLLADNQSRPGVTLSGGPGDDDLRVETIGTRTVSRAYRATLTGSARGTVELHRNAPRGAHLLARGTFDAPAGPLRQRLTTTKAGKRWIRRDPHLRVFVTVNTRTGGDRNEIFFPSRLR